MSSMRQASILISHCCNDCRLQAFWRNWK